ncbi:MAG: hypothetical protein LBK50_02310 [Candidatus Nomurabacteria bacterium]|jgi:hypothetical protein|nr:hypothetical protein [Candidatus Nomurabacteria bacterium]
MSDTVNPFKEQNMNRTEKVSAVEAESVIEKRPRNLHSSLALTLGIISIPAAFFWYIVLPAGILAIVFGAKSYRETGAGPAKAGFILGIIGLCLFAVLYVTSIGVILEM